MSFCPDGLITASAAKWFIMEIRFIHFLAWARWLSAIAALAYHVRFLTFTEYSTLPDPSMLTQAFYFLTGLGHEAFAVFVACEGIATGATLYAMRAQGEWLRARKLILLPPRCAWYIAALLIGGTLDLFGSRYFNHAGHYLDFPAFSTLTLSWPALLGNSAMLQPFLVPTFGSNGMLYLVSYLFWSRCIAAIYLAASALPGPWRRVTRGALLIAVVTLLPDNFHVWLAIWLLGLIFACYPGFRRRRPHVAAGIATLVIASMVSRWIGTQAGLDDGALGQIVLGWRYLIAALGFVVLAAAMAPGAQPIRESSASRHARFHFYFHFPFMMLLCGAAADLAHLPLMGMPGLRSYHFFTLLMVATVGASLLISIALDRFLALIFNQVAGKIET